MFSCNIEKSSSLSQKTLVRRECIANLICYIHCQYCREQMQLEYIAFVYVTNIGYGGNYYGY